MLNPITATSEREHGHVRSLVDRDEYGPLSGQRGGLFTVPVTVLLAECDELGRRLGAWVPDGDLL